MKEYIRKKLARYCMKHILNVPLFLFARKFIFTLSELKHIEQALVRYVAIHRNDNHQLKSQFYKLFVNKDVTYVQKLEQKLKQDL